MSKLKLTTQIVIGLGMLVAVLLFSNFYSILRSAEEESKSDELAQMAEKNAHSTEMELGLEMQSAGVRAFIASGADKLLQRDADGKEMFNSAFQALVGKVKNPQARAIQQQISEAYPVYRAYLDQEIALTRNGDPKAAAIMLTEPKVAESRTHIRKLLSEFNAVEGSLRDKAATDLRNSQRSTMKAAIAITIFSLLIALGVLRWLKISVDGKCASLVSTIDALARGDLNTPDIQVLSHDALGLASLQMNTMKHALLAMVSTIQRHAGDIRSASNMIADSATEQALHAQAQRDHTMRVTTSMQQMTVTIQEVAQNGARMAMASHQATTSAEDGSLTVKQALTSMSTISDSVQNSTTRVNLLGESSERIGQIARVIEEIASQTNLLALNASIESARAGEHGRGFAVVAGEVRRLAERTASATHEITQTISEIQAATLSAVDSMRSGKSQVEAGLESTTQLGERLASINSSVEEVDGMVAQIAAAATEQAAASEEISRSMQTISELVEKSSEEASNTEKTCHQLNRLSEDLYASVGAFHIS